MIKELEQQLTKLTMEERKDLALTIGKIGDDYVLNQVRPRTKTKVEAIYGFVEYLQQALDNRTTNERNIEVLNNVLNRTYGSY